MRLYFIDHARNNFSNMLGNIQRGNTSRTYILMINWSSSNQMTNVSWRATAPLLLPRKYGLSEDLQECLTLPYFSPHTSQEHADITITKFQHDHCRMGIILLIWQIYITMRWTSTYVFSSDPLVLLLVIITSLKWLFFCFQIDLTDGMEIGNRHVTTFFQDWCCWPWPFF